MRAHLVDLGMDADLANSLDEAELERCRDALAVYDMPLYHAYGEHTYNREDETGRADVEYVILRSWAVQLPDDQARYYLTFRWLQNPEHNIRDGLTGDPSSYDPSYDFSARILWTQDGQDWTAAPTVHLGGGETPEELPDWALEWYDMSWRIWDICPISPGASSPSRRTAKTAGAGWPGARTLPAGRSATTAFTMSPVFSTAIRSPGCATPTTPSRIFCPPGPFPTTG